MSRPHFRPTKTTQVATSNRGRDTVSPAQPRARSRHQNQVATLLETNLCRDFVPVHSGISRSRRQNPGRDLPHCYPCRDFKMMSRPPVQVATLSSLNLVATSKLSCDLKLLSPISARSQHQKECRNANPF